MSLTTIIALWGAGLSTFLAFWKDRPSHHIRYDDFANAGLIEVSVENRSDADIIVRGARVLSRRGVKVIFGDSIRENISSQLGRPGTLLRAGGTCTIHVRPYDGYPEMSILPRDNFLASASGSGGANRPIARPSADSGTGTLRRRS